MMLVKDEEKEDMLDGKKKEEESKDGWITIEQITLCEVNLHLVKAFGWKSMSPYTSRNSDLLVP